jgi:hypothetical protein
LQAWNRPHELCKHGTGRIRDLQVIEQGLCKYGTARIRDLQPEQPRIRDGATETAELQQGTRRPSGSSRARTAQIERLRKDSPSFSRGRYPSATGPLDGILREPQPAHRLGAPLCNGA